MISAETLASSGTHLPIVLVIGFAIFFGTVGARLFQRLRIPQVVGYIAIGLLVGPGLGLITEEAINNLLPFNFFALGIIGFMIGGELHRDVFKKYGRQFFAILFSEGLGAMLAVSVTVTAIMWAVTGDIGNSLAMGLVLGAISSATAPAATIDVLREAKARGPLTTNVFAIVALDDGLSLALYTVAISIATRLTGNGDNGTFLASAGRTVYELGGAVVLGIAAGFLLNYILRRVRDHGKAMAFIIGSLAMVIGIARMTGVDFILSAMALGVALTNLAPRRSHVAFNIVENFATPLYVLFFVIAGARLHIRGIASWMWLVAVAYVLARTVGKMVGANLGARWGKASESVRKYLGPCLLSQAGVAIGLAIMSGERLPEIIAIPIVLIVTATTFLVEILGPPCVKYAITKAGEVGLNVTEKDLMLQYKVSDVMDKQCPTFAQGDTLAAILRKISETDATSYPVVDKVGAMTGVITLGDLMKTFQTEGLTEWLVAYDLMEDAHDTITVDIPLEEAVKRMREQELESLPVITASDKPQLVGMLELRAVTRRISQEVLSKHKQADLHMG